MDLFSIFLVMMLANLLIEMAMTKVFGYRVHSQSKTSVETTMVAGEEIEEEPATLRMR